ncbi:MAG: hypothetical protein LBE58_07505 [Comamonas sp.]|nr:hypothetical protein [Comamonas sp.]
MKGARFFVILFLLLSVALNINLLFKINSYNTQLASIYYEGKLKSDLSLAKADMIDASILKNALSNTITAEIDDWNFNNSRYPDEFSCARLDEILSKKAVEIEWLGLKYTQCPNKENMYDSQPPAASGMIQR